MTDKCTLPSKERLYPWPEPVETLSITHIFDGEEVVTAGEDGQTWIATFASRGEAEEFVKGLKADPGTTVVGQRRRMADEHCMHGRVVCEPCAQMAVNKAIRQVETQPAASNLISRLEQLRDRAYINIPDGQAITEAIELLRAHETSERICGCIPLAPRSSKYCQDCGGLIRDVKATCTCPGNYPASLGHIASCPFGTK